MLETGIDPLAAPGVTRGGKNYLLKIELPAEVAAAAMLGVAVHAVAARLPGCEAPDALAEPLLAAVAAPMAHALATRQGQPDTTITASLRLDEAGQRLALTLDPDWEEAVALPAPAVAGRGEAGAAAALPESGGDLAGLGAGIFLVRHLMDEVDYTPQPGDNRWRMVKQLHAAAPATGVAAVTLELPAGNRYLNVVGECIAAMLGDESEDAVAVQSAAHEVCLNIGEHAYAGASGPITVTLAREDATNRFVVTTHDQGAQAFDLAAIPDRFDPWAPALRSGLISGSALLFVSATLVNAGNYLFNLILGRWLGPAGFADLSLVVTLFLVTSFLTAGLQTPAARFAAQFAADRDLQGLASVRRWSAWRAGALGVGLGLLFALGAPLWSQFFATGSPLPFVIFGLFVPFYLVQGVDRGLLQGRTRFGWLAVTYQAEMWSRLALSVLFVAAGWAVNGAVLAIGLSFVATWLVARRVGADLPQPQPLAARIQRELLTFTGPVLVAQLGQILINNSDILIVRRFFPAEEAGIYAALALIGRIVFFATWSVVTAMFPIVAQRHHRGQPHRHLLYLGLGVVAAGSLLIVAVTYFFPAPIVRILFGDAYLAIAPLLWLYALATMFYALANVVINYRLSIGSTGGTYLAIAAGTAQVLLLWGWHATLRDVVLIQLALMALLFVVLLAWDAASHVQTRRRALAGAPLAAG